LKGGGGPHSPPRKQGDDAHIPTRKQGSGQEGPPPPEPAPGWTESDFEADPRMRQILPGRTISSVVVTAGNLNEGSQAPRMLGKLSEQTTRRLRKVYADSKYHCKAVWEWQQCGDVNYKVAVERRAGKQFALLLQRWVVERTLA
jgi:hypothetical protein